VQGEVTKKNVPAQAAQNAQVAQPAAPAVQALPEKKVENKPDENQNGPMDEEVEENEAVAPPKQAPQQQQQAEDAQSSKLYAGLVVKGLPPSITESDEALQSLDSKVLYRYKVSQIEVVETTVRITFENKVSQKDIKALGKTLGTVLLEDFQLSDDNIRAIVLRPWRDDVQQVHIARS